jgi:hypothetical protein
MRALMEPNVFTLACALISAFAATLLSKFSIHYDFRFFAFIYG